MARKPRQKKTITLAEFKAWLEGVEELQSKEWTPDANQWKLIKGKLKSIVADEVVAPQMQPTQQPPGAFQPQPPMLNPGLPPGVPPPPAPMGSIPNVPFEDNSGRGPAMEMKTGAQGEKVLKTPDIDGEYTESSFG